MGDKRVISRLIDKEMCWHMMVGDQNGAVTRGIALHKMIRLVTLATINGGYLDFMGNEYGHPEWIDFPREDLQYKFLNAFDNAMVELVSGVRSYNSLNFLTLLIVESRGGNHKVKKQ